MSPRPVTVHFNDPGDASLPKANVCILGGTNVAYALAGSKHVQTAFTLETPHGPSPVIYQGEAGEVPFYHITLHGTAPDEAGAVAGAEGLLRTWSALHALGVTDLLGGATAGGINPAYRVGDWVVADDFIDFNLDRKRSIAPDVLGKEAERILPRYVPADDPELRGLLTDATEAVAGADRTHRGGVIAQAAGGRFETAAEVRMLRTLGADLVTLNVPTEMAYARQLNINFASIIAISNPGEGLGGWDWQTLTDLYPKLHAESIEIYLRTVRALGTAARRRVGDPLRIHPEFE